MNRTKLKNYAPQARRDFIQAVTDRAAFYGLAANKTESVIEQGDVAIIRGRAFPRSIVPKRQALISRIERQGFHQMMEAMAYTWFNRFVAIRFMELHGYFDHGYRVLSHPEGKQTPEILEHAEHVELSGLDRDKVIELKLDGAKEAELYRMMLVAQCNALHAAMPFLFEKIADETELLLPDNLLHSDSLIRKLVREVDEEDWGQVEIIGWLYEAYISEKYEEVIGSVVKTEDIPAATQRFTPNWIVKYLVQNSVGRMWLQTYPDSPLRSKMEYYIEPAEQEPEVKAQLAAITPDTIDPETITVLDPACGSGHILVEAYDLLKEIYLERGYRLRDIPRLILSKNLFGLDIDDRAVQLAAFALLMKARADDRRIYERMSEEHDNANENGHHLASRIPHFAFPNVLAIQESRHLSEQQIEQLASDLIDAPAPLPVPLLPREALFDDLSRQQPLIMVETTKRTKTVDPKLVAQQSAIVTLLLLFRQAKTFGSLVTIQDDVAGAMPDIAQLVRERLQSGNLYERTAAETILPFVRQAALLVGKYDCVVANPPYMGASYFNPNLKDYVKRHFAEGKDDLYGCFILRNAEFCKLNGSFAMITIPNWMFLVSFEKLRNKLFKGLTIDSLIHNGRGVFGSDFGSCSFVIKNACLSRYKGVFKRLFEKQGSVASNTELVRRFFDTNNFFAASDEFRKIPSSPVAYWVSSKVRANFTGLPPLESVASPKQGLSTGDNERFLRYWYEVERKQIGFSFPDRIEAKKSRLKWFPFNKGGEFRKWFGNNWYVVNWYNDGEEIKSLAPSSVARNENFYFKRGITWSALSIGSLSMRVHEMGFIFADKGQALFPITEEYYDSLLIFLNSNVAAHFLKAISPTVDFHSGYIAKLPVQRRSEIQGIATEFIQIARTDWDSFETSWDFHAFPILRADLKANNVEQSFLNWQAQCDASIRRMQELETENNRLFIEAYGLQDELSPEVPEDQITLACADREADIRRLVSYTVGCMMGRYSLDRPGLVYDESGNVGFDPSAYEIFPADADGIVPVLDADWFADDAANRFIEFVGKSWPAEHLEENLRYVAESLSSARNEEPRDTIRRYLAQSFFKDHLKTYKRRPIYWLFSSGKQRAFQCLVYLHRYNEGTLARMRTEYVIPLQGKLAARIQQLETGKSAATSTSHRKKIEKEQDTLKKQQAELVAFDEKLRHFADQRIRLDLDDGVKVNYGKFGDLLAEVKAVTGGGEE